MRWRSQPASKWAWAALESPTPDKSQTDSQRVKRMDMGPHSLFTFFAVTSTEAHLDTQRWNLCNTEDTPPSAMPSSSPTHPPTQRVLQVGTGSRCDGHHNGNFCWCSWGQSTSLCKTASWNPSGAKGWCKLITHSRRHIGPSLPGAWEAKATSEPKLEKVWGTTGENWLGRWGGRRAVPLQGGSGLQAEGGKEAHEAQVVRQPTLHGLKQEGWRSSEEPGWTHCWQPHAWVTSRAHLNERKPKKTLNKYQW